MPSRRAATSAAIDAACPATSAALAAPSVATLRAAAAAFSAAAFSSRSRSASDASRRPCFRAARAVSEAFLSRALRAAWLGLRG